MPQLTTAVLCALTLTACGDWNRLPKPDAIVASGRGLAVTATEFTARLEEQPPFVRAGYSTLERKKELLDSMVRFEVLAREAERLGLDRDPEVVQAQRKVMVQKLVQSRLQAGDPVITEAELTRYYEDHRGEYQQPKRARLQVIELRAEVGSPDREKKIARARLALAQVKAGQPFGAAVADFSEAPGGELEFQTLAELSARYGLLAAEALFALTQSQVSEVLETPDGLLIARVVSVEQAGPRPLDQVRAQLENKLQRDARSRALEEWVTSLKERAAVSVDEQALEAIQVTAPSK
ncbi:MAG: peptidylprolyl isomerase [Archangium sp.]|nr:peptidylprolyl isomerase [Archangium sp.]